MALSMNKVNTQKFTISLSEADAKRQARLLKALADPTRLRILHLLLQHEDAICVFEITDKFKLEQPTISHHLRLLRDLGLIDGYKRGLFAYYHVCRNKIAEISLAVDALLGPAK